MAFLGLYLALKLILLAVMRYPIDNQAVKKAIKASGHTIPVFAEKIGISPRQLSRVIADKTLELTANELSDIVEKSGFFAPLMWREFVPEYNQRALKVKEQEWLYQLITDPDKCHKLTVLELPEPEALADAVILITEIYEEQRYHGIDAQAPLSARLKKQKNLRLQLDKLLSSNVDFSFCPIARLSVKESEDKSEYLPARWEFISWLFVHPASRAFENITVETIDTSMVSNKKQVLSKDFFDRALSIRPQIPDPSPDEQVNDEASWERFKREANTPVNTSGIMGLTYKLKDVD